MLLVLCRHGQSEWNLKNLFTGWTDVDLSEKGVEEAREAGKALKANGFSFDVAYSSVLKRANRTMDLILEELGEENIEKHYSWRLNERHYGALQGLNKADSAKKWGDEQVHVWRRSANVPPPALTEDDPRFPGRDPKYQALVESGNKDGSGGCGFRINSDYDSSYVADPIDFDASSIKVAKNSRQPVWIKIKVPEDAVPGTYSGKISSCKNTYRENGRFCRSDSCGKSRSTCSTGGYV